MGDIMNKDHLPNSNVMIVGAKPSNRLAFRKMMVDLGSDNHKIDVKITIQEALSSFEGQRNVILVIDDDCKDLDDINLLINKLKDGDSNNAQFLITFITSDITSDLVKEVKKSPSTVSLYLSQIVADGLVEIKVIELRKRYHIKVRELVDKLIEEHRPRSLDKPTSGFEDIINSF